MFTVQIFTRSWWWLNDMCRQLTGICQLLTANMATLRCVEFYHSKLSGESLNKIGKAMCPTGTRHLLQHFALLSTRIFDQADLFAVNSSTDFLRFLCAARQVLVTQLNWIEFFTFGWKYGASNWRAFVIDRSLRSLKLCDNYLDQENVVLIMKIILRYAKNIFLVQLVDNEVRGFKHPSSIVSMWITSFWFWFFGVSMK